MADRHFAVLAAIRALAKRVRLEEPARAGIRVNRRGDRRAQKIDAIANSLRATRTPQGSCEETGHWIG